MHIAAMTTCRNDAVFLQKWIAYYSGQFGARNLFIIADGHDQSPPQNIGECNYLRLPHIPKGRVRAMRRRARVMSDFARGLHRYFDIVIATDVDEFLVLDPGAGNSLAQYLGEIKGVSSVSGLGLDVIQHEGSEGALDGARGFLAQRKHALISARYTKPATSFRPIIWGSGMHRVKGRNYHIDDNLYHFHFGMIDSALGEAKGDKGRLASGWGGHLKRRKRQFARILAGEPVEGDLVFEEARRVLTRRRQIFALNKPRELKDPRPVLIPERFRDMI